MLPPRFPKRHGSGRRRTAHAPLTIANNIECCQLNCCPRQAFTTSDGRTSRRFLSAPVLGVAVTLLQAPFELVLLPLMTSRSSLVSTRFQAIFKNSALTHRGLVPSGTFYSITSLKNGSMQRRIGECPKLLIEPPISTMPT